MKKLLESVQIGLVCLVIFLAGCATLPPVEFCYEHPTYGKVCVAVNGKKYFDPKLTPEQRAEVEKWIAENPK